MQKVIAENVRALMQAGRNGLRTQAAVSEAARRSGHPLDQKSVSRVLKAANAPQADTIEAIARAFDLEPYQLLVPGLDPRNPQVLRMLSPSEERLYQALEAARQDAGKAGTQ